MPALREGDIVSKHEEYDPLTETKTEFEQRYAESSSSPVVWGDNKVSMPCTCPEGGGPTHWAAIGNTPEMIELHLETEEIRET